jgi:hypothetical protein
MKVASSLSYITDPGTNSAATLDELGLLEEAENLDLRTPLHDYFDPLFSTGWRMPQLN